VTIRADREKTLQVLGNLLSNAVKFTPQGGRIEVGAGLDRPGWARIWVRDSGIGIPPDQLDRIFEKFHQVERPGGPKPPGSGLGLTLAHHLVTLHGGRLWAESRPGEGATFTFEMPLWSPPAAAESAKEVGSCAQGTDSRRG
ncbi:MAG TPA: ATP-binding protein, partial [Limnochorda sp.]